MRATTSLHWGFPCSDDFLFHACRRHYPGGTVGCCRYPVQRRRPSQKTRRVGFRNFLFEAGHRPPGGPAFTHVPACMVAESPKVTRHQSTSTHSLPPAPPWLLPAERPIGRAGLAPAGDRRLSRHTGFTVCVTPHEFLEQSVARESFLSIRRHTTLENQRPAIAKVPTTRPRRPRTCSTQSIWCSS